MTTSTSSLPDPLELPYPRTTVILDETESEQQRALQSFLQTQVIIILLGLQVGSCDGACVCYVNKDRTHQNLIYYPKDIIPFSHYFDL